MKIRKLNGPALLLISLLFLSSPFALLAQTGPGASSGFGVSKESVFWTIFWILTAILVFAFLFVAVGLLRSRDWQLGDAVSEEAGNQPNPLPPGVKPVMVASSSRLLALLGLLSILGVFLGFGYYFLYSAFAGPVNRDDMKSVIYYLFSGAVMFAPYLANQLRDAFSSLGGTAQAQSASPASPVPAQSATSIARGVGAG